MVFYSLYILKTAKRQFYCMIMHRYFGTIHKEKGSGRVLRLDPFFRGGLCFFFFFTCFAFYFTILILYTTGFNPRTNTDIIILLY